MLNANSKTESSNAEDGNAKTKRGRKPKASEDAHNILLQILLSKKEEEAALEVADQLIYVSKSDFWRQLLLKGIEAVKKEKRETTQQPTHS